MRRARDGPVIGDVNVNPTFATLILFPCFGSTTHYKNPLTVKRYSLSRVGVITVHRAISIFCRITPSICDSTSHLQRITSQLWQIIPHFSHIKV